MTIIAAPPGRAGIRFKRPSDRRSLSRSATRALDVLECFGDERRRLRAVEIGRMLRLQGSSANQLLKTMVDSAHLVFDARTKTYYPSPRMVGFASLVTQAFGVDDRLRMLVDDLQLLTRLSITLTTPNGAFMQILRIEMPSGQNTERGSQIGVFGSAVGSAYLAGLPDSEIESLARRARIDPAVLPDLIGMARKVRQDGYADGGGAADTYWTVAMPIPGGIFPIPLVLAAAGERDAVRAGVAGLAATMSEMIAHWIGPPSGDAR